MFLQKHVEASSGFWSHTGKQTFNIKQKNQHSKLKSSDLRKMPIQAFDTHLYAHKKTKRILLIRKKSSLSSSVIFCFIFIWNAYPSHYSISSTLNQGWSAWLASVNSSRSQFTHPVYHHPLFPYMLAQPSEHYHCNRAGKFQVAKDDYIYTILFYYTVHNIQQGII